MSYDAVNKEVIMFWFIIYMTISGWQVASFSGAPAIKEGCYLPEDRPLSHFCVVVPVQKHGFTR